MEPANQYETDYRFNIHLLSISPTIHYKLFQYFSIITGFTLGINLKVVQKDLKTGKSAVLGSSDIADGPAPPTRMYFGSVLGFGIPFKIHGKEIIPALIYNQSFRRFGVTSYRVSVLRLGFSIFL